MAVESGGGQHGSSFDTRGHRFVCSNSNHIIAILYDNRYASRNPEAWGIMLYRNYPRDRRYQMFANKIPRGNNCFICNENKLTGLENLPPGVLEQLDKLNPPNAKWQRKSRMSQLLTSDIGHPHVEKLVAVHGN